MTQGDRTWLKGALDNWQVSARRDLGIDPDPLPDVVTLDDRCLYIMPAGRFDRMVGTPHEGHPSLPDGREFTLQVPKEYHAGEEFAAVFPPLKPEVPISAAEMEAAAEDDNGEADTSTEEEE